MTDEEMAEEHTSNLLKGVNCTIGNPRARHINSIDIEEAFLAGLKAGRPPWHKIFEDKPPYSYEYYDLPQNRLPKIENFYFVKLKNGFIKICELKYDAWSRKKYFYDLHGGKQSDVAEWLDYPTFDKE